MDVHRWNVSVAEARRIQESLRNRIRVAGSPGYRLVAGCDVAYGQRLAYAAVVVFDTVRRCILEEAVAETPVSFPYIPGMLAFREGPPILKAWKKLKRTPDAVLLDGHGIAVRSGFGLACHMGLWLDLPSVGCAKTILIGTHDELPREAGNRVPLIHTGKQIGTAVRTRAGVRPVYVSPGHRIGFKAAVDLVLRCCAGFRIPEPLRHANRIANACRSGM